MLADEEDQDGDWDEYRSDKPRPCNNWVLKPKEPVPLFQEQDESSKSDREEDVAGPVDVPNPHGMRRWANEPPGEPDKRERPGQVEIIEPRPTEALRHEPANRGIERRRRGGGEGEDCQSEIAGCAARQRCHHGNEQQDRQDARAKALHRTKDKEAVLAANMKAGEGAESKNRTGP